MEKKEKVSEKSKKKNVKKKKRRIPPADSFLKYMHYKHSNRIGAEYRGLNGPNGTGPISEKT